ncbi:IclR family transcriptional regulator [Enterococcus dongliensis]|uniref:IclR family transcriptional regulator n=1 Tax=Enterococcus dongliensis TaxID=2559925 RepID=A0AAP5U1N6_9ENTE|nr:IclR family transcriptional regulator [Enterococcus dongliensis]MDT2596196.1 IclR family transcriptional regulator [Enterococcus dongliensis]MDT2603917.1 IclR family transcriptional regulator [Enterococcus dongliensis]MDT2613949.1 IclR family transcriptional regulator [Enterococcus dongliensis]MDT2634187.1 IclR family transcriptional regulator [Enterococcus dongliensis]MDT2637117.1 IclR family transcriptional regulator [Enterococcus dongliensis]
MEKNTEKKLYGSVLLKAAKILDTLAKDGGKTIQELSKETGITPSNLSKILETLIYIGYVIRDEAKLYYLGTKFMEYNTQNIEAERLLAISRPYLEELRAALNETIHLSVLENNKVVYIDKLEPQNQGIYMTSRIGLSRPLYSSGMGKAILSTFTQPQLSAYLDQTELVQLAKNTITDRAALTADLAEIRKRGFSIDDEEQEDDGYCVAVTIEKHDRVVGAMSVSFPKFRFSEEYRQKVVTELLTTKANIEKRLR